MYALKHSPFSVDAVSMLCLPGRRASRPALVVGVALTALVLAGCQSGDTTDTVATTGPGTAQPAGSDASSSPAGDTDSVQTDAPPASASLVVTSAVADADGTVRVGAFVEGVVELDGTCTATVTPEPGTATSTTVDAEPGPATTDCGPLEVEVDLAGAGSASVVVTYTSSTQDLTSSATEVELP